MKANCTRCNRVLSGDYAPQFDLEDWLVQKEKNINRLNENLESMLERGLIALAEIERQEEERRLHSSLKYKFQQLFGKR